MKELAQVCAAELSGPGSRKVEQLCTDSRRLTRSGEVLFIAITGEQHDGHNFLEELYLRGVRCFMIENPGLASGLEDASVLVVKNSLKALQELAAWRRASYPGPLLAITGSNGKTIVKEWIYQLMADEARLYRSPGSYNSQLGVALSLWGLAPEHELAILEAGISQPGEMERLKHMLKPDIGLFTHAGSAHQEYFSSLEEKLGEKLILFKDCEKVICSADSRPAGLSMTERIRNLGPRPVSWSLQGQPALYQFRLEAREGGPDRLIRLRDGERDPEWPVDMSLPFSDEASVENLMQVICFALEQGMEPGWISDRLGQLEPVSMRLQTLQGLDGSILINDAYNSDLEGLKAALSVLGRHDERMPRVLILSDLYQSGLTPAQLYLQVAELLESGRIHLFVGVGPDISAHASLFPANALFYTSTSELLEDFDRAAIQDRVVLIKGSRSFGFERLAMEFQLKVHATRLEIDLNALSANLKLYRSKLDRGVKLMAMVKALSYGAGSTEVARILQYHRVDYLAVAFIDEGIELRRAGIHLPIMVMNPDPDAFESMIDQQLEPEVFSLGSLKRLHALLRKKGVTGYPVHLKMDTGMHRLGFLESDIDELLEYLQEAEIRVESIFTHLAAAGEPEHDAFTLEQLRRFELYSKKLSLACGREILRHALNTAGIERFGDQQYEMVRLGLGLYGPGGLKGLQQVSILKTVVSQVKEINEEDTVGYSRAGRVKGGGRVATIPLGYADGFPRSLGNGRGKVVIKGRSYPTLGNICMDMSMIDVSGSQVREGDEVEIFGSVQRVEELADQAGTIPYEILSTVSSRVKRVYLQD